MGLSEDLLVKVEQHKEKIGELLMKHSSLTRQQLEEALEIQRQEGTLLGDILLRKNFVLQHDVIKVICLQIGIPHLSDLKVDEVDPNLVKDLSINYAKHQEILPIYETNE